jgi:hypothetical protein
MSDWQMVKRLGGNRVGGYAVLWGDATKRDLTGEFFTPETEDLETLFKAMGKLPLLYEHAADGMVKTKVIGPVDVLTRDEIGLWYEAQLSMAEEYEEYIQRLLGQKKLRTSSGTLPTARRVNRKTGQIERWAIAELSLTTRPAEPRMVERPVAMVKSWFDELGMNAATALGLETAQDNQKAANMGDWIESRLHSNFTLMMDDLFADGRLTRDERIALSGALGSALDRFHTELQATDLIALYRRGPWDEADRDSPYPQPYGNPAKAGRRLSARQLKRLAEAQETIADLVRWANYEEASDGADSSDEADEADDTKSTAPATGRDDKTIEGADAAQGPEDGQPADDDQPLVKNILIETERVALLKLAGG